MHTENDSAELGAEGFKELVEETQDESLGWLLDMDPSEPEDKLFDLNEDEYQEEGLSEYEAELAGRPLSRGNHAGDDLSQFVGEEIVVSSEVPSGNIYSGSGERPAEPEADSEGSFGEIRAIDHSKKSEASVAAPTSSVEDGSDILGLADDDDMGEKFLTIKRVKHAGGNSKPKPGKVTPPRVSVAEQNPASGPEANVIPIAGQAKVAEAVSDASEEISAQGVSGEMSPVAEQSTTPAEAEDGLGEETLDLTEIPLQAEEEGVTLPEPDSELEAADLGLDLDLDLELVAADAALSDSTLESPATDDWLEEVELDLAAASTPLTEELVDSSVADDWLEDVELDLAQPGATLTEEVAESSQSDDWLGDAGLELAESAADEEPALTEAADWLGDSDLELTGMAADDNAENSLPETTEPLRSLGAIESLEALESIESLESLESIESLESLESIESLESLESIESLESLESIESLESMESIESLESLESIESLESMESIESLESLESIESLEPLESIESSEATTEATTEAAMDSTEVIDSEDFTDFAQFAELEELPESVQLSGESHAYDPTLLDMIDNWMDAGAGGEPIQAKIEQADLAAAEESDTDQSASDTQALEGADAVDVEDERVEEDAVLELGESDSGSEVVLTEAPVTGRVVEPGEHTVANEDPLAEEPCDADTVAGEVDDNVLGYVAHHQAPLDDAAFDEYLLRGAHLQEATSDLDELEVERTEGIVSVDPTPEVNIDYHDDFRAMEGFQEGAVSAITTVISGVMEEISCRARARLEELGMTADAIEVDVMLGSDPESIKQCYAEGFEPVTAICQDLPSALLELGQAEIESIYVRLFHGQTNENRNDLFTCDDGTAEDVEAVEGAEDTAVLPEEVVAEDAGTQEAVFGDDIFDADSLEELDDIGQSEAAGDIDALFDDLVDEQDDSHLDVPPEREVEEPEIESAAVVEVEEAGFDEDIFTTDFSGELSDITTEEAADIDTVFSDLQIGEADSGDICGLDVEEFSDSDDLEVLEAVAEIAESSSTISVSQSGSDMGWCIPEGIAFNYTSQSSNEIFADFLDAFIEEGAATVEKLEDAIGEWERDICSDSAFAPVGRILHTLKGIAKGVGLQRYGTLIHNFETLLEGMPRPEAGAEAEYFRIVNAWLDTAVRGLEFVRENRVDVASELPTQRDDTKIASEPEVASGQPVKEGEVPDDVMNRQTVSQKVAARQKKRDQELADEGAKALAAQQSVRITSEKLDHLLNLANQAQQLGVRSAQSTNRSKRASAELQGRLSSVRTHIAKIADRALLNVTARGGQQPSSDLDALEMDQYSELQEAANILREAVEDLADLVDVSSRHNAVVEAQLKQQATVISTIGSSIQAARVVPVSRLMPGLRRIVRTVSADLDKSVAFKVLNETGALDRDHYARCQIILEHMVRNALDHGIESPEERLAVGKATTGRITIDVRKSGGDYFITLTDDGRGIDPYEMRESAFRKGLDIDVDALTDEEAARLIFHKGFSTANSLSEISGRGVGMDIVLSELQQIGGDIQVQSKVGQGTTFEVHIPANVTVNGALFVTAGDNSYAIPLNGLIAVEQVSVADFFNAVEMSKTLPLFDMDCEPAYLGTLCNGETLPDRDSWGDSVPVIIAGSEKRYMAIAIDNVEEALELVIRSLGSQFANVPGVAGGATTTDGEAIVALDLNLLVGSVAAGELSAVSLDSSSDKTLLALVVDDSRTQRMVTTSQFDTVGVETITAENGLVAIDLLNTTHRLPDVVLLDVEMPVKDGIETLREIRKSARYKHLPVIMVTSRTGAKHRALAEEAGCDGYMGKPFNFAGLIEQINELTGYELNVS